MELQAPEKVADGGDMGGGLGVEVKGVANVRATVDDMVHETLEGSQGARRYHGHEKPLERALRNAERCELH